MALVTYDQGVKVPLLSQFYERGQQLSQQVAQLATLLHGESAAAKDPAEHTVGCPHSTDLLGLLVLGPVFAILIMVLIIRSISQPLTEMTAVAQRLAAGDITNKFGIRVKMRAVFSQTRFGS